jgi:septal ring factor EnvC (AmiA/AmiB activator)
MKRLLLILLVLVTLGLCAVCVVQWVREDRYRANIADLAKRLEAENTARVEAERKAAEYEKEIERLTILRAEVEAKLLATTEELTAIGNDSVARGFTLAIFLNQLVQTQAKLAAMENAVGKGTEALKDHNASVTAQNATITKQNELLKQLAAERNTAIEKLNDRTKEFNELVEKYNKLAKSR